MGYYSRFDISEVVELQNGSVSHEPFSDKVQDYLNDNGTNEDVEEILFAMEESCKFYDYHEVMKRLSEKFPDKMFSVMREGEDSGDMEMSYYKNNKMLTQRPIITWPEFNEEDFK